jgi:CubicO group peptidase (beta-lactamase class C family)
MIILRAAFHRRRFALVGVALILIAGRSAFISSKAAPANAYPGLHWDTVQNVEQYGWSRERLRAAEAQAVAVGSAAGMIVTGGRVVASWGDVARTFQAHSVRKSFMNALYGIYIAEGKIDTSRTLRQLEINEKPTSLTAEEQSATVLDLLRSRSGVYLPTASENEAMRESRPERGSHRPGTFWYYNNWDFNALGTIFRNRTGADIFQTFKLRIADPLGMEDFDIKDERNTYVHESYSMHPGYRFRISARDLARFGLLYLRGGRWRERQLIPEDWVRESTRSHSNAETSVTKSGYGMLWWVAIRSDRGIPIGAYTASGNGGQRLTVFPSLDTVVVNLMNTDVQGPRLSSSGWDRLLEPILQARIDSPRSNKGTEIGIAGLGESSSTRK